MLPALGALSSALDALQSLTSSKSASPKSTGFNKNSTNPFDLSENLPWAKPASPATSGSSRISPATMSALIAAQSQASDGSTPPPASRSDALKDLFSQIDADRDGTISRDEFKTALGAGGTNVTKADAVFDKLKGEDESVSLEELSSALRGRGYHHQVGAPSGDSSTVKAASSDSSFPGLAGRLQHLLHDQQRFGQGSQGTTTLTNTGNAGATSS